MSILTRVNVIQARRLVLVGVVVMLGVAITTGFYWMQTNHVIAPPTIRFLDWAWRVPMYQCLAMSTPQALCLPNLPIQ